MPKIVTYEWNGIKDNRTGWAKRLGLTQRCFDDRIDRLRRGKLSKEQAFSPVKGVHTKYELKMSRKDFCAQRKRNSLVQWADVPKLPPNHTVRIWETVFNALKALKPESEGWSQFFIRRFKLPISAETGRPLDK